jgi:hypothetical protein
MKKKSQLLSSLVITVIFTLNLLAFSSFANEFQETVDQLVNTTQGNIVKQTKDGGYYMANNPNGHISFISSSDDEKFMVIENGVNGTTILKLPASTNPRCENALPNLAKRYLSLVKDGEIKFYDKNKQTIEIEVDFELDFEGKNLNDEDLQKALQDKLDLDLEGFFYYDLTGIEALSPRELWDAEFEVEAEKTPSTKTKKDPEEKLKELEIEYEIILDKLKEASQNMDKETLLEIELQLIALLEKLENAEEDMSEEEWIEIQIEFEALLELLKSKVGSISQEEIDHIKQKFAELKDSHESSDNQTQGADNT